MGNEKTLTQTTVSSVRRQGKIRSAAGYVLRGVIALPAVVITLTAVMLSAPFALYDYCIRKKRTWIWQPRMKCNI